MKKLLICLLTVFMLIIVSCKQNSNNYIPMNTFIIPYSIWDSDNIRNENTNSINTNGVCYNKTSSSAGIIGTFKNESYQYSGATGYTQIDEYTFLDTGYYSYTHKGKYPLNEFGKYTIHRHSDSYFIIKFYYNEISAVKNQFYYQVKDNKITFTTFTTN